MEDRTMTVSADIKYVGVNDHEIDLFEGQYVVPNGSATLKKCSAAGNRIISLSSTWNATTPVPSWRS